MKWKITQSSNVDTVFAVELMLENGVLICLARLFVGFLRFRSSSAAALPSEVGGTT